MIDIVTIIGDIVSNMEVIPAVAERYPKSEGEVFYMAGHLLEVTNRLINKTKDMEDKYLKYPMIVLHLDTAIPIVDNVAQCNLNILIVTETEKFINAEQRQEEVFNPILIPIYKEFIKQLVWSGQFMWTGDPTMPPHTMIQRPYYGFQSGDKNIKSKTADPLDAIEIINLKINKIIC